MAVPRMTSKSWFQRHAAGSVDDEPVFFLSRTALVTESLASVHGDALDLAVGSFVEHRVVPPRPLIVLQSHRLKLPSQLGHPEDRLDHECRVLPS